MSIKKKTKTMLLTALAFVTAISFSGAARFVSSSNAQEGTSAKAANVVVTGNGDWSQTGAANGVAKSVEGVTGMGGGVTGFGFPDWSWTGVTADAATFAPSLKDTAEDGYYIGHFLNGWGWTVSRVMSFNEPVKASDVDAIIFRIAGHFSSGNTYGVIGGNPPHGGTGIYLYAADSDGSKGDGVLIPYDVKQDEWVDLTFTGEDLVKLTDANGNLSGFWMGFGCISEANSVLYGHSGDTFEQSAYILIDSVKIAKKQTVTYYDGESVLKTEELYTGDKPFYMPEKEDYAFTGWTVNSVDGKQLGADEALTSDIGSLYATWTQAGDLASAYGVYATDYGMLKVFEDGTVDFSESFGKIYGYSYGADGFLYVFTAAERLEISLSSETKKDSVSIYCYDGENGDELFYRTITAKGETITVPETGKSSFQYWSASKNGRKFDFSEPIEGDLTLYAVNRYAVTDRVVITGTNDFTLAAEHKLTSVAGTVSMNDGTSTTSNMGYRFNINNIDVSQNELWAGSDDGKAFSMLIAPWGFSLGKAILFNEPVKAADYETMTFRLFAHLSPKSPYGGFLWGGVGIRIFGSHSDGSDTGVLIPLDITQDEWVDLTIGRDLIDVLAADDGYIYGFTIGSGIVVDTGREEGENYWHTTFDWAAQRVEYSTYVLVDYITVATEKTLSYCDSDGSVLNTQNFSAGSEMSYSYVPEKDGSVFAGWTAYESALDYSEVFYQSVNLYANWVAKAGNVADYVGLYRESGKNVISVYSDGTVEIDGRTDLLSCGIGEDGVVYVACKDGMYTYDLSSYDKVSAHTVTVEDGDGNSARYLVPDGETLAAQWTKPGYTVAKASVKDSDGEFVFGTTAVTSDLTLTLVWEYDEIADYASVYGNYYYAAGNSMIILGANHMATVEGEAKTYRILTSSAIMIDGLGEGSFLDVYFSVNGKNYVKLGEATVSFFAGRETTSPEKQTVSSETNYKVTKPADPVWEGYRFVCWMTAGNEEFDFNTIITGSTQLFAKWERVTSQKDPVTPSEPSDNGDGDGDTSGKKGCGSAVSTCGVALAGCALILGAFVAIKKKKAE